MSGQPVHEPTRAPDPIQERTMEFPHIPRRGDGAAPGLYGHGRQLQECFANV